MVAGVVCRGFIWTPFQKKGWRQLSGPSVSHSPVAIKEAVGFWKGSAALQVVPIYVAFSLFIFFKRQSDRKKRRDGKGFFFFLFLGALAGFPFTLNWHLEKKVTRRSLTFLLNRSLLWAKSDACKKQSHSQFYHLLFSFQVLSLLEETGQTEHANCSLLELNMLLLLLVSFNTNAYFVLSVTSFVGTKYKCACEDVPVLWSAFNLCKCLCVWVWMNSQPHSV